MVEVARHGYARDKQGEMKTSKLFRGGTSDVGRTGQIQSLLSTIELGYVPFVPFSARYLMGMSQSISGPIPTGRGSEGGEMPSFKNPTQAMQRAGSVPHGAAASFQLSPVDASPLQPTKNLNKLVSGKDWSAQVAAWNALFPNSQNRDEGFAGLDDLPIEEMGVNAALVAERISRLLDTEVSPRGYGSPHKGEVEERAILEDIYQRIGGVNQNTIDSAAERLKTVDRNYFRAQGFSREGIDLTADSVDNAKMWAHTQQALNRMLNTTAFNNIIGIETTNDRKMKFFQRELSSITGTTNERRRAFETMVQSQLDELLVELNIHPTRSPPGGINMANVYKDLQRGKRIGGGKYRKKREGVDSVEYFSRQLLDRFRKMEVTNASMSAGNLADYEGLAFQFPISNMEVGYVIFSPQISGTGKDAQLTGLNARTFYENVAVRFTLQWPHLTDVSGLTQLNWHAHSALEGTHANMLLLDAFENLTLTGNDLLQIINTSSQAVANRRVFVDEANTMVGSIMLQDVTMSNIGIQGQSVDVTAMELLSATEDTDMIRAQVMSWAMGTQNRMSDIISDAYRRSNDITNTWRRKMPNGFKGMVGRSQNVGEAPAIFGLPYESPSSSSPPSPLSGVGAPFWMTIGRNPFAYKVFRNLKNEQWKKQNMESRMLLRTAGFTGIGGQTLTDLKDRWHRIQYARQSGIMQPGESISDMFHESYRATRSY